MWAARLEKYYKYFSKREKYLESITYRQLNSD